MNSNQRPFIFLHIPKTAGTTVNDIFKNNYSEEEFFDLYHLDYAVEKYKALNKTEKENLKIIKGHFPYGIHRQLEIPSYQYITILRNPLDRVISQYHHSRKTPSDVYYEKFTKDNIQLKDCMGEGLIPDNLQVRYLSGKPQFPLSQCKETDLEKAKTNLTTYFIFGISELFDQSLLWLNTYLKLDTLLYLKKHVTYGRPKIDDYPEEVINQLKKYNWLDMQLYEFARKKFLQNIEKKGQSFQVEINAFKSAIQENNKITDNYFNGLKLLRENKKQEALTILGTLLENKNVGNEIKGEVYFLQAEHTLPSEKNKQNLLYRKSLELFQTARGYNRLNTYRKASIYKRIGDYKKAAQLFSEEIEKKRNTDLVLIAGCYYHLGDIALIENKVTEARNYFTKCVSANPNHKKAKEILNRLINNPKNVVETNEV